MLGEFIRGSMDEANWNVTGTAARCGCEGVTLSRLLNGKAGVSVKKMALTLEGIGWDAADRWESHELVQARRFRPPSPKTGRRINWESS